MLVIIVSKSIFVMKKLRPLLILFVIFGVTCSVPAFSQVRCDLLQATNPAHLQAQQKCVG